MKTSALIALFVILHSSFVIAQGGPLTPPGPPGATMTTLSNIANQITTADTKITDADTKITDADTKITSLQTTVSALKNDPRTVITTVPLTISAPGSYILGGSLTVTTGTAITITTSNVTLDLNGYTLSSTASPASGVGILIDGANRKNIHITNGSIAGTTTVSGSSFTTGGFNHGITVTTISNRNLLVSHLRVTGVGQDGITLGLSGAASTIVEHCTATICGGAGIVADTARRCNATACGNTAIETSGSVIDCEAESVGTGINDHGIVGSLVCNSIANAINGVGITSSIVHGCTGTSSSATGISAQEVTGSRGSSSSAIGINASGNVTNSTGVSNSSSGIYCTKNVTNSTGTSNTGPYGLRAFGTASFSIGQRNGGVAIEAEIAIGCTVAGTGTVTSAKKFLGTP